MKFVVIGGDAAGMSAASRAKRHAPDSEVIVFEKTEDVSYSACGMPYNIADPNRAIDDLVVRQAQVFRDKQGIDLRTGTTITRIDRQSRQVQGEDATGAPVQESYDALLIATGARPIIPNWPGVDLPGVVALKSLADGRHLKALLEERQVKNVVIIGMGYIGLEMAEALRERGIGVQMVKPRAELLPWMARPLAETVQAELEKHDVELALGHRVEKIETRGEQLDVVCGDRTLTGELVLVAIGVTPNSELARDAGLELGPQQTISVDERLRTSDASIYAGGDCADALHLVSKQKVYIPLALRANRAGWAVADNVCGKETALDGVAGTAVFKVFDLEVARSGLSAAEAAAAGLDPASVVIKSRSRAHSHPGAKIIQVELTGDRATGKLLGAAMVGPEGVAHRINAIAVALHAGLSVQTFAQTDLAYAPPFGPTWDPMLTAANQLLKKL